MGPSIPEMLKLRVRLAKDWDTLLQMMCLHKSVPKQLCELLFRLRCFELIYFLSSTSDPLTCIDCTRYTCTCTALVLVDASAILKLSFSSIKLNYDKAKSWEKYCCIFNFVIRTKLDTLQTCM